MVVDRHSESQNKGDAKGGRMISKLHLDTGPRIGAFESDAVWVAGSIEHPLRRSANEQIRPIHMQVRGALQW